MASKATIFGLFPQVNIILGLQMAHIFVIFQTLFSRVASKKKRLQRMPVNRESLIYIKTLMP